MLFAVDDAKEAELPYFASPSGYDQDDQYYAENYSNSPKVLSNLAQVIENAIQQMNFETAVFLSELLYTESLGFDKHNFYRINSTYLYCLSLYMNRNYHTAFEISKTMKSLHISIAYIYGRCCLELSRDEETACLILVMRLDEFHRDFNDHFISMPNLATIHSLIGKLYQRVDNTKSSIQHHIEALKIDPFLWESLSALCNMKALVDLKLLFYGSDKQKRSLYSNSTTQEDFKDESKKSYTKVGNNVITSPSLKGSYNDIHEMTDISQNLYKKSEDFRKKQSDMTATSNKKKNLLFHSQLPSVSSNSVTKSNVGDKDKLLNTPPSKLIMNDSRASFKTPRNIMKTTNTGSTIKRRLNLNSSANRDYIRANPTFLSDPSPNLNNDMDELRDLIYIFAKILKSTVTFNCYNAIRIIREQLPTHLGKYMPWCQAQLGKLHYEIQNYKMALSHFERLRIIQPTRLNDLEIFSTLLWHLHDKVKLSNLANELIDNFPEAAQTWCVLGNHFSLQKDHDEAIKAFNKATELDPRFAYAYTLQGHEYASNESFDTARTFYRKALACDSQHYNAYYGLGTCDSQNGNHDRSLLFFEKARMINPVNIVLICCCGVELEKVRNYELALKYYDFASKLQPNSALAKYRKAELLFSLGRYSLAVELFEDLIKLDSENPNLHYMLGKIYQTMGRKKDAVKEYTVAMNLDPKGNQYIIDALENCHAQD
ncbi:hypothetical protein KAFR_0L01870 [Kazachstania africana CBS 2517]|uniref:Anaphase-promoting complex subunit 3 n=1 Tax=Kazachstania africana (strain ATCC 22294 / BCRC 22015 / CBS 2517 / CECT 1963 / NBRC 1671 / NRRL Y-8276) TaxID=1071382 RepID=H2B2E7_KAZAF|nr:hypothetical protein KAFR_0L01870 [Kazachstania africana CBS 2517]CCF60797.1 hypothetical protein KAFR_0L01870 [Kazachstania africana CBS 2517]